MEQHKTELVELSKLKPHSNNYRRHNETQLKHIVASIKTHGLYRNVVAARDGTILAGHGVVEACKQLGVAKIPIVRLNIEPNDKRALKLLTGDNEISRLGEIDDRLLSEILRDINITDELLGTGFDEMQLANYVFTTRPETEIADFNAALEWVGLPAYEGRDADLDKELQLVVTFDTETDRDKFVKLHKIKIGNTHSGRRWNTTWPFKPQKDPISVKFKGK
jgi:hypothetical protein